MNINNKIKENAINIIIFVFLINYGFIHFCVLQGNVAAAALQDYGFISVLTAFAILSAELLILWHFTQTKNFKDKITLVALAYMLQIYLCREADMHTFFTEGHSVTNLKYYKHIENPLLPKIIAATILILFFISCVYVIFKYFLYTLQALFRGEAWAVALAFWGTLFVSSQIYDRMNLPENPWRIKLFEEYLEFAASVYLPAIVLMYKFRKKISSEKQ